MEIKKIVGGVRTIYAAEYEVGKWIFSDGTIVTEAFARDYQFEELPYVSKELHSLFERRARIQREIDALCSERYRLAMKIRSLRSSDACTCFPARMELGISENEELLHSVDEKSISKQLSKEVSRLMLE